MGKLEALFKIRLSFPLDGWPRRKTGRRTWVPHVSGLHVGLRFCSCSLFYNLAVTETTFLAARSAIFILYGIAS